MRVSFTAFSLFAFLIPIATDGVAWIEAGARLATVGVERVAELTAHRALYNGANEFWCVVVRTVHETHSKSVEKHGECAWCVLAVCDYDVKCDVSAVQATHHL